MCSFCTGGRTEGSPGSWPGDREDPEEESPLRKEAAGCGVPHAQTRGQVDIGEGSEGARRQQAGAMARWGRVGTEMERGMAVRTHYLLGAGGCRRPVRWIKGVRAVGPAGRPHQWRVRRPCACQSSAGGPLGGPCRPGRQGEASGGAAVGGGRAVGERCGYQGPWGTEVILTPPPLCIL